MPDTAVVKTNQGWIDRDNPAKVFRVRREAREARRAARGATGPAKAPTAAVSPTVPVTSGTTITTGTATSYSDGSVVVKSNTLTSLQFRLFVRLTNQQNVTDDQALEIILNNGYNKAASYGHMRAAGANHYEARAVIGLDSPSVSLAYGQNRAAGMNHTDALAEALRDDDD